MNTNEARQQALALMHAHGLLAAGWTFKWDRAKRRFGQCRYNERAIVLSFPLTALSSEASVTNTIIHEVAHALTPGHKHGPVWKSKFISMGGNGSRTANEEDSIQAAHAIAKYRLECAVTGEFLGTVNRRGKRLASASCVCHRVKPVWITQN